jgi:hypothetical protein
MSHITRAPVCFSRAHPVHIEPDSSPFLQRGVAEQALAGLQGRAVRGGVEQAQATAGGVVLGALAGGAAAGEGVGAAGEEVGEEGAVAGVRMYGKLFERPYQRPLGGNYEGMSI